VGDEQAVCNLGHEVPAAAAFCPRCGVSMQQAPDPSAWAPGWQAQPAGAPFGSYLSPPAAKYCAACGNGLVASAAICPRCGTAASGSLLPAGKSKAVAVILAVFFSFWSWLYTYKQDGHKFWTGLGITLATFVTAVVGIAHQSPGVAALWYLGSLGVWIWSVVDAAVKDFSRR
jgi:hypothetical protein